MLFVFGAGRVFSKLDESLWHNTREIREFYFNVTYVCFINELMYCINTLKLLLIILTLSEVVPQSTKKHGM